MITIKNTEVTRIEKTIDIVVEHKEIPYRFRAITSEHNGVINVYEIHFVDKYEVPLRNSLKKQMRNIIRQHLEIVKL